ncbi:MAG: transcription antitermination factor NusB [Gammaproteobacteria bacterium]
MAAKRPDMGPRPARRGATGTGTGDKSAGGKRMGAATKGVAGHRARSMARRLALQALYQIQLNPRSLSDTQKQFAADPESDRADLGYFRELMAAIAPQRAELDVRLALLCEIPPAELDPIEHAVLWLGLYELTSRAELPYRVALAEAVQLAKQFGATDGHKFVNAVLDRAARELRPNEYGQPAA